MNLVLCHKKLLLKVKETFNKIVVRPAISYGSKCWTINKKIKIKMKVAEMIILKWMCSVNRMNKIKNEYIRRNLNTTYIARKMRKNKKTIWSC